MNPLMGSRVLRLQDVPWTRNWLPVEYCEYAHNNNNKNNDNDNNNDDDNDNDNNNK